MAKSGEAGDSPAPKEASLPAAHAAGHNGIQVYTGDDSRFQSAGDYLEVPSGAYMDFPYPEIHNSKYAGLGPMIAAGVYFPTPPVSLDLSAISGRFSNLHSMALAGDTTLEAFRPPVTRTTQLPVVLQSPLDRRTVALFREYMKRSLVLQQESLNALFDKREDRAEKKKLKEERLKFEQEKRQAYLSLEEERKQFEEYKKQFQPKAVSIEKDKETIQSKIVNNLETTDKHISLFEKVVGIPKRSVALGKDIKENKKIVKKLLQDNKERTQRLKQFGNYLVTWSLGFMKEQIKEMVGLGGSGDAGEGLNDGVEGIAGAANGAGNGALKANGTGNGLKVVNGTGNAPNGALKVPSLVPKVPAALAGATVSTGAAAAADVATTGSTISGGSTATVSGTKGE